MKLNVSTGELLAQKADAAALFCFESEDSLSALRAELAKSFDHAASIFESGDFKAKLKSSAVIYTGNKDLPRLFLIGLGKKEGCTAETLRRAASAAAKRAASMQSESLVMSCVETDSIEVSDAALALFEGAALANYRFDKYITSGKEDKKKLGKITLCAESKKTAAAAKGVLELAGAIYEGVTLARDLANAPNNEIYPETLAKKAQSAGKDAGFKVTVLDKKKIESLKMGGLLAVNQGSVRPPVFIVMEYKGGKSQDKPIVFVGKGITFDTGGISIKPGAGMGDMKMDMHGAASVIGAITAIAKAKLPVNVIALVPSTENMPSGSAYVPGDIITFMNGKTAEIDNTDAEGRLVLADALTYADRYKPQAVVDLATLTGACVIALGNVTTGMMGTDDALKNRLKKAAERTNEYVCELPLYEEYEEQIKSDVADVKNAGGRGAGAITAALFLKKFIGDYPWVHLDIAGTGMSTRETDYMPKGGTGIGVRLLVDMVRNW
jgi:leucyl aminopeptidase